MKIKLAILDSDVVYLRRIVTAFTAKYAEKLEVFSFTKIENAMQTIREEKVDVFIASSDFDVKCSELPAYCGFAYFTDNSDIATIKDKAAICKFQKAELIYKQILSIYAETADTSIGTKEQDGSGKITIFTTPCGGVGNSTMAAAYSVFLAEKGKKVVYLNLERFSSTDAFFTGEGQFNMSDIIYAVKSKKANLQLKLEVCTKKSKQGVEFFAPPNIALDMLELKSDEVLDLILELKSCGYEYIVIDMDFGIGKDCLTILSQAYSIVLTSDGTEIANGKIAGAIAALNTIEQDSKVRILNHMFLAYNKCSNQGELLENTGLTSIGIAPKYAQASVNDIVNKLSTMDMFQKIM